MGSVAALLQRSISYVLCGLIAACASFFGLFVLLVGVNDWILSDAFKHVTAHTPFPFIDVAAMRRDKAERYDPLAAGREWAAAIYILWGLTIAAAILTLLLRQLSPARASSQQPGANRSRLQAAMLLAQRLCAAQIPPHGFWFYWCGGLTVGDAAVVAIWFALNVIYVEQRVVLTNAPVDRAIAAHGGTYLHWNKQQAYLATVSGALSWAATLDIMLLFYPVPRSSFLHWLSGSSFPALIKYHRWLGHATMVILTLHGWGYWASWLWEAEYTRGFIWDRYGTNMLAGAVSWFCGAALWVTSLAYIRRQHFELFYRTHILGFLGFIIFGCIHHAGLWVYAMPGLLLYLLDVTFRIAQQAWPVRLQLADLDPGSQLALLQFDTDPSTPLAPIQELYVSIGELSPVQWHPFTTIPGEHPASLLAIIKKYGSWTGDLVRRLQGGGEVLMRVDGPYGDAVTSQVWTKHRHLVIFAGGIGVTPVLGMLQDMHHAKAATKDALPESVALHFTARLQSEIALLQCRLVTDARRMGWLRLKLYMTGKGEAGTAPAAQKVWQQAHLASLPKVQPPAPGAPRRRRRAARMMLPPYNFGDAHWAVAHVLALVGALLGSVAGWWYGACARRYSRMGAPDWLIGLTLLVASCVGAMVLPALIIVPAHILRALRLRRRAADAAPPAAASMLLKPPDDPEDGTTPEPPAITQGRPRIATVLGKAIEQHHEEATIGVIAAGPEPMVEDVIRTCAAHNAKVGLAGSPWLDACKYTFSL